MKRRETDKVTPPNTTEVVQEEAVAPFLDRNSILPAGAEIGAMPEALEELAKRMGAAEI